MLTAQGCLARRERLWGVLPEQIEWVLIADPRHVHYFSNFWINPLSFSSGERAFLVLERGSNTILIGDNFALRSAFSEPVVDEEVVGKWYDHKHSVVNRTDLLASTLGGLTDRLANRQGLIEKSSFPLGALESLALTPSEPLVEEDLGSVIRVLRRKKESDEVALLGECLLAAEAGHARALEIVRPGITEFDVYQEVQAAVLGATGQPALVYGDFRAATAARPKVGGLPTNYTLQEGDLFILDFSVVLDGYRGDTTNTIHVGGKPSESQLELFAVCCSALQKGEGALVPGTTASGVFDIVSSQLETADHGPLVHHAGHGIGLAHPEPPILVPESEDELVLGDVVTLEPGLYVKGIGGIRLEHNYLITENGFQRLSDHFLSL